VPPGAGFKQPAVAPPQEVRHQPGPKQFGTVQTGDRLVIQVEGTLPDRPIRGVFVVEPSGKVQLGPLYGRVDLNNLTLEGAEKAIRKHLEAILKDPLVAVTRYDPAVPGPGAGGQLEKLEQRLEQVEKELRAVRETLERIEKKLGK
jgi:protein involved in polysaccharide export with SLBB domain